MFERTRDLFDFDRDLDLERERGIFVFSAQNKMAVPGSKFYYVSASARTKTEKTRGNQKAATSGWPLPLSAALKCWDDADGSRAQFRRLWNETVASDDVFVRKEHFDDTMPKGKYQWNIRRMHEESRRIKNRRGVSRLTRSQLVVRCRAFYKLFRVLGAKFWKELLKTDNANEDIPFVLDEHPTQAIPAMQDDMDADGAVDIVDETDRWVYFDDESFADVLERNIRPLRWSAGPTVVKGAQNKLTFKTAKFVGQALQGGSTDGLDDDEADPIGINVLHGGGLDEDSDEDDDVFEAQSDTDDEGSEGSESSDESEAESEESEGSEGSDESEADDDGTESSEGSDDDSTESSEADDDNSVTGDDLVGGSSASSHILDELWKDRLVVTRIRNENHLGVFKASPKSVMPVAELEAKLQSDGTTISVEGTHMYNLSEKNQRMLIMLSLENLIKPATSYRIVSNFGMSFSINDGELVETEDDDSNSLFSGLTEIERAVTRRP